MLLLVAGGSAGPRGEGIRPLAGRPHEAARERPGRVPRRRFGQTAFGSKARIASQPASSICGSYIDHSFQAAF
ncbi:hypothetical protein C0214_08980 [Methylobacterium sp. DM1]|nr:hypothetical protein C0214_08980 [Methylobacterium sp. DM1]